MRYFIFLTPLFLGLVGSCMSFGKQEDLCEEIVSVSEVPEPREPIHWHKRW